MSGHGYTGYPNQPLYYDAPVSRPPFSVSSPIASDASSASSSHNSGSSSVANPMFIGNILFWTSAFHSFYALVRPPGFSPLLNTAAWYDSPADDPRETIIWGQEPLEYNGIPVTNKDGSLQYRPIEFRLSTPVGYSVQTKTFIDAIHGGPSAECVFSCYSVQVRWGDIHLLNP